MDRTEIVPLPYGAMLPDLTDSYNYNSEHTPDWLLTLCPNCGSDHVCCLSDKFNPELDHLGRWFCISCHDSWEYGLER